MDMLKKLLHKVNLNFNESQNKHQDDKNNKIAIVGVGFRFPGDINDSDSFWNLLSAQQDVIGPVPMDRDGSSDFSWHAGYLNDIDKFDAKFFNISRRKAEFMDPQQRILLEIAFQTFEDAGYSLQEIAGSNTGVYIGWSGQDYHDLLVEKNIKEAYLSTGTSPAIVANHISYWFDLKGPSEILDTACSSSLSAIHQAVMAIRTGSCAQALVGATNLTLSSNLFASFEKAGMLSPDNCCKTFDEHADGYVRGEGIAALLLKPLVKAQQDNDRIYGVVLGSAINHGGKTKSLTAPNPSAQIKVITSAYSDANISPRTVNYVETHGTGTALGDPIEVQALENAFKQLVPESENSFEPHSCGLGSVKTNLGHLEPSAGLAGVIKVLLSMQNQALPGNVHFKILNPNINLENSYFYVVDKLKPWERFKDKFGNLMPYRVGVSSFGFGGTNAHLVLEEGMFGITSNSQSKPYYLLTFSAKHPDSFKQRIKNLLEYITIHPGLSPFEMEYTLNARRNHFKYRGAILVSSVEELRDGLINIIQDKECKNYFYNMQGLTTELPVNSSLRQLMQELHDGRFVSSEEMREKLCSLGELYVKGYEIPFRELYQRENCRVVSLPPYPFLKDRYWIPKIITDGIGYIKKEINLKEKNNLIVIVEKHLIHLFSDALKVPIDQFSVKATFEEYGFDSLLALDIVNRLSKDFSGIHGALLFEYNSIETLAEYLVNHQTEELKINLNKLTTRDIELEEKSIHNIHLSDNSSNSIAIIGISGKYPGAKSLDDFWENLKSGKSSVSKIPVDRWSWNDSTLPYPDWGCFITDVDKFDPLFFHFSPKETEKTDPQERLFLLTAWATLEDAGYTPEALSQENVGVFVGAMHNDYSTLAAKLDSPHVNSSSSAYWSIANRVSYFCNFKGPSLAVDTACSSSLTALHLACESLRQNESTVALSGGVNLILHPAHYTTLYEMNMLSETQQCKPFGVGADGFVSGEGVGAVLLKPLEKALSDGDHIYGVILSSSVNSGGKTSGYSVPNPHAQAKVIQNALIKSGINPQSISYVEAHGTGTSLGDPIEIRGLTKAFDGSLEIQSCPIGSVKSNIGHLESAAGIVSLTKVLLQMKHKQLAPSLHAEISNPHIDFYKIPFYVQRKLSSWEPTPNYPRRAAISSFGAGGSNAHVIVEETPAVSPLHKQRKPYYLITLSAKNPDSLKQRLIDLHYYLQRYPKLPLEAVSYTLNTGRCHFNYRFAAIVDSVSNLQEKLQRQINNVQEKIEDCFYNCTKKESGNFPENELEVAIAELKELCFKDSSQYRKKLLFLAEAYVYMQEINWAVLHSNEQNRRISLPTYPFLKERYWLSSSSQPQPNKSIESPRNGAIELRNDIFNYKVNGEEFYLKDHKVEGNKILPGVVYLEMARAAGDLAIECGKVSGLRNVVWIRPLIVDNKIQEFSLVLYNENKNQVTFKVITEKLESSESILHAQGELIFHQSLYDQRQFDISEIKQRCFQNWTQQEVYKNFEDQGITYGHSFKSVVWILNNGEEAISELKFPDNFKDPLNEEMEFYPSFMDGMLQTTLALMLNEEDSLQLPFSIDEIIVSNTINTEKTYYSYCQRVSKNRYDLFLLDDEGYSCVVIKGFVLREVSQNKKILNHLYYRSVWKESPLDNFFTIERMSQNHKKILIIYSESNQMLLQALIDAHADDNVTQLNLSDETTELSANKWKIKINDSNAFNQCLSQKSSIDIVYFLAERGCFDSGNSTGELLDTLNYEQERGVLTVFRLLKSLNIYGFLNQPLVFKVVTQGVHQVISTDTIHPFPASILGLAQSVAYEHSKMSVSCIDLPVEMNFEIDHFLVSQIISEIAPAGCAEVIALRNEKRFMPGFEPLVLPEVTMPVFLKKGNYLIVGGAGGLGFVLSQFLAKTYQANIIWIGRSSADSHKDQIERIEKLGGRVFYYQTDVNDIENLQLSVHEVKQKIGQIHGVVHSALILKDKILARMDEESFLEVLQPKVAGSVALYETFKNEPLDFFMFFSSIQSFIGNAGQSNYAAGSTFQDAFALSLNQKNLFPIKLMNWGYWGSVGVVASKAYRDRLKAQGLYSIEPSEGIEAINQLLATPITQFSMLKASSKLLQQFNFNPKVQVSYCQNILPTCLESTVSIIESSFSIPASLENEIADLRLERLGQLLLLHAFQKMKIFCDKESQYNIETLKQKLQLLPKYTQLFSALLDILYRSNYIINDDGVIKINPSIDEELLSVSIEYIEEKKRELLDSDSQSTPLVEFVCNCVLAYPEILTGKKSHMEVMFPQGSMSLIEGVYRSDSQSEFFNKKIAALIQSYINQRLQLDPETTITILEIGAGTGGTSVSVLPMIQSHHKLINYIYTDISKAFVKHGENTFSSYSFVEFRVFDIEQPIESQDFKKGSIDLIFASNVVHATYNIKKIIKNLKSLLKMNGLLILNEVMRRQDWATLSFGLTEGWWLFEDNQIRIDHSPLLSVSSWLSLLEEVGFRHNKVVNNDKLSSHVMSRVIVSESDGWIEIPKDDQENVFESKEVLIKNDSILLDENMESENMSTQDNARFTNTIDINLIEDKTRNYLKYLFSKILKLDKSRIEDDETFENYGVDSLVVLEVHKELEKNFSGLSATLLFEYITINQLVDYLIRHYRQILEDKWIADFQIKPQAHNFHVKNSEDDQLSPIPKMPIEMENLEDPISPEQSINSDIAIIGLSGRYPQAMSVNELWKLLVDSKSAITEIPADRWNWRDYFDPEFGASGKSYSKWGGFIQNSRQLDTSFFGVTPMEASVLDPQERIFLETAWNTFEDAGYSSISMSKSKVGVFVGVMHSDYSLYQHEVLINQQTSHGNLSHWSIANRVSYCLDLHGPSIAINTACSSSLVAIHLACESIKRGECEMALSGGVNLLLHPHHYIGISQRRMLSKGNTCSVFSKNADGIVLGEGVGAVLLKPLNKAIEDGDYIYGVIKGTAINAGGKTSGYTVPNPNLQSELIKDAMKSAAIEPASVSYIEAHGTGTVLGDPIEIQGLTKAFGNVPLQSCSIGSVKANIGHLESAAGIAALTKVLLQLKHKKLTPSISSMPLNSHIGFEKTPFYVQNKLADWERAQNNPRRAGISSFGAGGTNAHIIIEDAPERKIDTREHKPFYLITLSAKHPDSIKQRIKSLFNHLTCHQDLSVEDVSYTLNVGRNHFNHRMAFIVNSMEAMHDALEKLTHEIKPKSYFEGEISKEPDDKAIYKKVLKLTLKELETIDKNDLENYHDTLEALANLYVKGYELDWELLHLNELKRRVPLPGYPFLREDHWILEDSSRTKKQDESSPKDLEKIAIIGVSGQYPMANNLEELWENLKNGKDCVSEIPRERWDYRTFYDPDKTKIGKCYGKWGGFIDDVDKFDPLFFNISPYEAGILDPQERLFLQTAWETFEDSGYTKESMSNEKVGVFVGVMYGLYQLYGAEETAKGNNTALNSSFASIANRVSYCLDLKGPSFAIDTMCSSSFTAIHLACESIRQKECDLALAGGVNIASHPNKYLMLSGGRFLSSEGKCKSFGKGGDGYVPGEGIGAVLLKSYEKAVQDGDQIYGVICGSAINHNGHTNGYSVPSSQAQSDVIRETFKQSNIPFKSLSYIEAHGTGTNLGDPIEIQGLTEVFGENLERQSCPIGSIKSNVGHLESASGIIALTKVLLQMKHKQLAPSLHAENLNPHISFSKTPFYLQRELSPWEPTQGYPRRAGISTFGAGGSNAYIIVEEGPGYELSQQQTKPYYLIAVSAKHPESLKKRLIDLEEHLNRYPELPLEPVSYTLNSGRSHFDYRFATIVDSIGTLKNILKDINNSSNKCKEKYYFSDNTDGTKSDNNSSELIEIHLEKLKDISFENKNRYKEELLLLADFYVQGNDLNWDDLHARESNQKTKLPFYPFLKETYWVKTSGEPVLEEDYARFPVLHPLVHYNVSTMDVFRFKTKINSNDFNFRNHKIQGKMILPAVSYLEMAQAAGQILSPDNRIAEINSIRWLRPLTNEYGISEFEIDMVPKADSLQFKISSSEDNRKIIHCKGQISFGEIISSSAWYSSEKLKERLSTLISHEKLYNSFKGLGIDYGPTFQSMKWVKTDGSVALGCYKFSKNSDIKFDEYQLHPGILDCALQTVLAIALAQEKSINGVVLPYSLDKLKWYSPLPEEGYVIAIPTDEPETQGINYQFQLINKIGNVCLELLNLSFRSIEPKDINENEKSLIYYTKQWLNHPIPHFENSKIENQIKSIIIFTDDTSLVKTLRDRLHGAPIIQILNGNVYEKINNETYKVVTNKINDYICFFDDIEKQNTTLSHFIFNRYDSDKENISLLSLGCSLERELEENFLLIKALQGKSTRMDIRFLNVYLPTSNQISKGGVLAAFSKNINLENSLYYSYVIEIDDEKSTSDMASMLIDECLIQKDISKVHIRHSNSTRKIESYKQYFTNVEEFDDQSDSIIKSKGIYLITGGFGGIGYILAEYLVKKYKTNLVLTGRSSLDEEKERKLNLLREFGSEVHYLIGDVTQLEEVKNWIKTIKSKYSVLDGIIHSAGINKDELIVNKSWEDFKDTLATKLFGAINLDQATKDLKLKHFILISSLTSILGNRGQSDYASANAFLDVFANWRDEQTNRGERHGKALSIDWPYWSTGGMKLDEVTERIMQTRGFYAMPETQGLAAFEISLHQNTPQFIVAYGINELINKFVLEPYEGKNIEKLLGNQLNNEFSEENLNLLNNYLKSILIDITKIPPSRISMELSLESFGVDSIMRADIIQRLTEKFQNIDDTMVFTVTTLKNLADYLLTYHKEEVEESIFKRDLKEFSNNQYHIEEVDKNDVLEKKISNPSPNYYQLSNIQEHLYSIYLLNTKATNYNIGFAVKLLDELNVSLFTEALNIIIKTHSILRMSFSMIDDKVMAKIDQDVVINISIIDLVKSSTESQDKNVNLIIKELQETPFDLSKPPLFRFLLIKLNHSQYVFVAIFHHIIIDGWSLHLFLQNLTKYYNDLIQQKPLSITAPSYSYTDHVYWQKNELENKLNQTLSFWKNQLFELSDQSNLFNTDMRKDMSYNMTNYDFSLSSQLSSQLEEFSQKKGVTIFSCLLSVYQILLSRYLNQSIVVTGVPFWGRDKNIMKNTLGPFINTLPLAIDCNKYLTFNEIIKFNFDLAKQVRDFQLLPLALLLSELKLERTSGVQALFKNRFNLLNFSFPTLLNRESNVEFLWQESGLAECDLSLEMEKSSDYYKARLQYNANTFDTTFIKRLVQYFIGLLKELVKHPDSRISDYLLVRGSEKVKLLKKWNGKKTNYPHEKTVHQLFEEQTNKTPDNMAVIFNNETLTYKELDQLSTNLAVDLQKKGVQPDKLVGICVERSFEMIIGILAILKSGGAYVPIDPNCPIERFNFICKDSEIDIILTQRKHIKNINKLLIDRTCQLISIPKKISDNEKNLVEQLKRTVQSNHLIYVIYTSGSTGQPKGVMVDHKSVVNALYSLPFPLKEGDVCLLKTNYTFDASARELFTWFLNSSRLVILNPGHEKDPSAILEKLYHESITHINFVPSMLNVFLNAVSSEDLRKKTNLKYISVGGEYFSNDLLQKCKEKLPESIRIANLYGPTETTVDITSYVLTKNLKTSTGVPIGTSFNNTQLYVLSFNGALQPIGFVGELHVSGDSLARGYLNHENLNKEKFIHNPFSTKEDRLLNKNLMLYKTGDLVRWLPDGNLEYIERLDYQVKIRGFRIECREIESILIKHSSIENAIVVLNKSNGTTHLVAYIILFDKKAPFNPEQLKAFLQNYFPDYMIPSHFICMDEFPTTVSGKINRIALINRTLGIKSQEVYVAPKTIQERQLAEIWRGLLGVEHIGVHDNFFDLGGHSLLLAELHSKVKTLGYNFKLIEFLSSPTINGITRCANSQEFKNEIEWINLNEEAILNEDITGESALFESKSPLKNVFLTGATGFIGAFLLRELLTSTSTTIFCLVRSETESAAFSRLNSNMFQYGFSLEQYKERVKPVLGDLEKDYFGLNQEEYEQMSYNLDIIYHNGAYVHHVSPYSHLKSTNVKGTKEVLRLAATNKIKPVQFISTLGIFSNESNELADENANIDFEKISISEGYIGSKWVAEKLVMQARTRGIPCNIFRLGRVVGDSKSGVGNINDFFNRYIKTCIQLGYFCNLPIDTDITPVDFVAKAIVNVSREFLLENFNFHLKHPQQHELSMPVHFYSENYKKLTVVSPDEWLDKIESAIKSNLNLPIAPYFSLMQSSFSNKSKKRIIKNEDTITIIKKLGIEIPNIDDCLIKKYLEYLEV